MEANMSARIAAGVVLLFASVAAAGAEPMDVLEARRFVVGNLFSYTCFEGTRGAGRIYSDGSVAGTIQVRGSGPVRHVRLPPNTVREKGGSVCASLKGLPFSPCFTLNKTSPASFRGAIYGLSFAYCEFHRRGRRIDVARTPEDSKELQLRASIDGRK
jgi:hypothetical protein